ncbi:MAG: hypothetical protein J1E43_00185 [Christensenellaceae bacterium]|nr:hypothetical protein [Christensenellaceae bacterium]
MPTSFTNQATLSYNNLVTNSNVVTGTLQDVLSVSKSAISGDYRQGDTVTYAVSVINSGSTAFSNLTLTDNLGAYASGTTAGTVTPLTFIPGSVVLYVNGTRQATAPAASGSPLTITGINVPAGGNILLLYSANANQFAPQGSTGNIVNTVTLSGTGISTPITATATTDANATARLSVIKSLNPTTVVENQPLTYTFTIQNTGATATTTADNLILTDVFDPALNITSVTLNGVALTQGTDYNYNAMTGTFSTVANRITVPAATYTQNATTGAWTITPGTAILQVTGTL